MEAATPKVSACSSLLDAPAWSWLSHTPVRSRARISQQSDSKQLTRHDYRPSHTRLTLHRLSLTGSSNSSGSRGICSSGWMLQGGCQCLPQLFIFVIISRKNGKGGGRWGVHMGAGTWMIQVEQAREQDKAMIQCKSLQLHQQALLHVPQHFQQKQGLVAKHLPAPLASRGFLVGGGMCEDGGLSKKGVRSCDTTPCKSKQYGNNTGR